LGRNIPIFSRFPRSKNKLGSIEGLAAWDGPGLELLEDAFGTAPEIQIPVMLSFRLSEPGFEIDSGLSTV
jgi:hypothetical protein